MRPSTTAVPPTQLTATVPSDARPPRIAATALLLVAYLATFAAPFGIGALAATVVRPGLWDERIGTVRPYV